MPQNTCQALVLWASTPPWKQVMQRAQNIEFHTSFAGQKNDMRLRDCTDIYGWLKALTLLSTGFTIQKPYIFKLYKAEKSFFAIGTMHILPLEVYPKHLLDILLKQKVLVTEPEQDEPTPPPQEGIDEAKSSEVNSLEVAEATEIEKQENIEVAEWFEELPARIQHYFVDIIGGTPAAEASLHDIRYYLLQVLQENGMDQILLRIYDAHNLIKLGLETREECLEEEMNKSDHELLKDLIEGIEDSLSYGGIVARPESISSMESYISGKAFVSPEENPFVIKRNIKWMSKLSRILEEYPTETLVAVGAGHFFGKNGLLAMHHKDGWSVERSDLIGEFHSLNLHDLLAEN